MQPGIVKQPIQAVVFISAEGLGHTPFQQLH